MKKIIINVILGILAGTSILAFSFTQSIFYLFGLVGNVVIFTLYNKNDLSNLKGKIKTNL